MTELMTKPPTLRELGELVREGRKFQQVELKLVHRFAPGMYIRELTVPADTYIVTKIHHTEHPYVISKGRILVWTETGGVQVLSAPYCSITKPGTIRLAKTLEETVWTTFHATNETDIAILERDLATDPAELLGAGHPQEQLT